jgi:hypothetical protein
VLLARKGVDFLPGWRVVKSYDTSVTEAGLSGMQGLLFEVLHDGKDHHERHVIGHLWPEEAADPEAFARLRNRLRQLQHKTNQGLALFRFLRRVRRRPGGRYLFLERIQGGPTRR